MKEPKQVYIVWNNELDDYSEIYGVFSTIEKAREFRNVFNAHNPKLYLDIISNFILDSPTTEYET